MPQEKQRACRMCKKKKPAKDGYVKFGVFFCCGDCCGKKGKKEKKNVCDFC